MAKKTTLYLDEAEAERLRQVAEQDGISQGAIISRALRSYFRSRTRKATSVGKGRSGRSDLSEQASELLDGFGVDG